ncbi:hypothetical protein SUDANB58_04280 [Streptomyces sp. enrichment culture]|uniref:hypothetical protein n=1 Tax=Streptomyces sp. enrichment culture TaxID=1795815 RepID=UPI003F54AA6D
MLALRLSRGARLAARLRSLLVAAASAGTGFLLLCALGHALSRPASPAALTRLAWCAAPLAATVYFALAVARTDPGTRPRPGLSAAGLGPGRLAVLSATATALSCALGSVLALLSFLHLRGDLTGRPLDGAAGDALAAGQPLPLPAVLTLLTLVPATASATVALALRPREARPGPGPARRYGRFGAYGVGAARETFGAYGRFGARRGTGGAADRRTAAVPPERTAKPVPEAAAAASRGAAAPTAREATAAGARAAASAARTGSAPCAEPDRTADATAPAPAAPHAVGGDPHETAATAPAPAAPHPADGDPHAPGTAAPHRATATLPWGIAVLTAGLAVETYAGRADAAPGTPAAGVLTGWVLTALGLALAGPGLTHLCGRLVQAFRPGALRLLAGRTLMEEASRIGRPLGVVCAVASAAHAATALSANGGPPFGPLPTLGALVVAGCAVATLLTAAVETRQARAGTTAALLRLGASGTVLRAAAALRAVALLALFGPLTLAVAKLAALPPAR